MCLQLLDSLLGLGDSLRGLPRLDERFSMQYLGIEVVLGCDIVFVIKDIDLGLNDASLSYLVGF